MKKIHALLLLALTAIGFIQCKKDKDTVAPPDLRKDLLAYFRLNGDFDDSAKNVATQFGGFLSSIKNRHGYSNRAMSFNGGLFSFGASGLPANPLTISLWIKVNDLQMEGYLILPNEKAFGIYQDKSKLGLSISTPETATALGEISTDWTHFAGTYNGSDIKTYINGKLASTVRHPGYPDVSNLINMGAAEIPEWKGALDDIRFYQRVLSDEEIKILSTQ